MHPKTHANLTSIFNMVFLMGGLILLCGFASSGNTRPWFIFAVMAVLAWTVLAFWPVRCQTPGCRGHMRHKNTQESMIEQRLVYRCTKCEAVYETTIFGMNVEFGGG